MNHGKKSPKAFTTDPPLTVMCKSAIYKMVENCEMIGSVLDKNKI
jgi:hypothetical protein